MTTCSESSQAILTLRATTSLLSLLPKIGGLVLGLSGIAYLTGWREMSAYFRELGVPWALALLSPSQIMQASIWLINVLFMFGFLSVYWLVNGAGSQRSLRRWSIIFLGFSLMLHVAVAILESHFDSSLTHLLIQTASFCLVISAGLTIGELIACLAVNNLKWDGYGIWLLFFVVVYGFSKAPEDMGTSRAKAATEAASVSFPLVQLLPAEQAGKWHLVGPLGDKLLLVSLTPDEKDRQFKLVTLEAVNIIHSRKFN